MLGTQAKADATTSGEDTDGNRHLNSAAPVRIGQFAFPPYLGGPKDANPPSSSVTTTSPFRLTSNPPGNGSPGNSS